MSETHPMDYYGRIRELEARVAELQADQHCPTCGSSVYTCVDCDVTPLRARVAELEAQRTSTLRHVDGRESYWLEQRAKWIAEHDRYAESCKWHADRAEKAEAQVAARGLEVGELVEALRVMVASAAPHPVDHPAMTEAWRAARAVLAKHGTTPAPPVVHETATGGEAVPGGGGVPGGAAAP